MMDLQYFRHWGFKARVDEQREKDRAAIIEECAKVAETFHCAQCGMDAATAIRALKEKG